MRRAADGCGCKRIAVISAAAPANESHLNRTEGGRVGRL